VLPILISARPVSVDIPFTTLYREKIPDTGGSPSSRPFGEPSKGKRPSPEQRR
jgi:hypothetical protein